MATTIPSKPAAAPQKLKRPPPPPTVQTSANGVKSSLPHPSPSPNSKGPSPGSKHPPSGGALNGVNGVVAGAGSRMGSRRRDSQKPSESISRPNRAVRGMAVEGSQSERRVIKLRPEPYVRKASHILRKYRKSTPSMTVHLHPTHFRFDQQDGSCLYNSPMAVFLEHIKLQTIPHDMMDEFTQAGIKFYEGCLIIQVQDHRSATAATQTASNASQKDKNHPFSVHNYNEHLTPSPYVPFPQKSANETANAQASSAKPKTDDVDSNEAEKENMLPPGQVEIAVKSTAKGPKIFTTVMFSTPLTLQEEILKFAHTPDMRANSRKQSTVNGRTSSSAGMPATPLSAVPITPLNLGPPAKKQKMAYTSRDLANIESKIIASTAPPLFLEPVENMGEAQKLLEKLQDPLFCAEPPAPKSRKRTVAELAADEALAAEEQRFMLIMDERLVPSSTSMASGKPSADDGDAGAASFAPRFERFKAIEEIKLTNQEKLQREIRAKQESMQASQKAKQEQAEVQARQQEQRSREAAQVRRQEQARMHSQPFQQQQHQQQQQGQHYLQQHHMTQSSSQHAHPTNPVTMGANGHQLAAPMHVHQGSPVARNRTPQNVSSPMASNMMMSQGGHSVPMSVTASGQGAGSPPRPGSALQHGHPNGGVAMGPQRSHQPSSRNGTPQISNGTPRMQQATPPMRNVSATPRINHASPTASVASGTPVLGPNIMATPHMPGQPRTPQQQMAALAHHRQQQQQQQAYQTQAPHMQANPSQNSSQNLQQLAVHQRQQAAQNAQQMRSQELYRQGLQGFTQQQMSQAQGGQSQQAPTSQFQQQQLLQQQQQHLQQQQQQQLLQQQQQQQQNQLQAQMQAQMQHMTPQQNMAARKEAQAQHYYNMFRNLATQMFNESQAQAHIQYGAQVPQTILDQLKARAQERASTVMQAKRQEAAQQAAQRQQAMQQQHQQRAQMQNGGMMGGG